MARPKKLIDQDLVRKLASIHCTNDEIAAVCEVDTRTIERRFAALIKKARENGKSSLRRYQWESAQKGNVVMQIWLGKQLLGQRDQMIAPPQDLNMTVRVVEERDAERADKSSDTKQDAATAENKTEPKEV